MADADQATARVRVVAEEGARSVGEAVAGLDDTARIVTELAVTIQQLAVASTEIGAIVEAIEDIAEQTNLLALNAAIEAARAGEHGRGFAVVADEVRKLAGRAANATHDIQQRIGSIQTETDKAVQVTRAGVESITAGARTAGQAGDALQRISASVSEVSSRVRQIASATHEQTQAADRIVAAAEQMEGSKRLVDEAVQHMTRQIHSVATATARQKTEGSEVFAGMQAIARAVEEMSASTAHVSTLAGALLAQANGLHEAVAVFELGTEEAGDPADRKALAPAIRVEGPIMV
ncbi:Methyl-accepting chemotaxis protein CtpH [compost metagenome]